MGNCDICKRPGHLVLYPIYFRHISYYGTGSQYKHVCKECIKVIGKKGSEFND